VCPTQEPGIIHLNAYERQIFNPREGNGGEISAYQQERRFLSMGEYSWEAARHGQQTGGGVTTPSPQPGEPQHFAKS